jgi:uncharacterized protein YndB with AHSA1/START domain
MHTLKRSLEIDAPPTEVWRVLTTPELVREWASVYVDGISIRTSWREGERVAWKEPSGATRAEGTVGAFQPERLLKFDYCADPAAPVETRTFSDIFEISEGELGTRLRMTTGPLDEATFEALKRPSEDAIREIKSLAEESAQIRAVRR